MRIYRLFKLQQTYNLFFIVPTHALHYIVPTHALHNTLTLKSHAKTLKIRPYMFWSPLKPSSGVHGRTSLGYWIGMLIYICYKECRYAAVCQFIPSVCMCVGTYLVETVMT